MKNHVKNLAWLSVVLLLAGCATVGQSLLLGAGVGAGVGAGTGRVLTTNPRGIIISAAVGTAVGAGISYLIYKSEERKRAELLDNKKSSLKSPMLTAPQVRRIWEPDRIDGNRFIHGHYIDVLEKTSTFSQ